MNVLSQGHALPLSASHASIVMCHTLKWFLRMVMLMLNISKPRRAPLLIMPSLSIPGRNCAKTRSTLAISYRFPTILPRGAALGKAGGVVTLVSSTSEPRGPETIRVACSLTHFSSQSAALSPHRPSSRSTVSRFHALDAHRTPCTAPPAV